MFFRGKSTSLVKPKKLHSLEYLKYLCSLLQKNALVTEQNSATIVEAIRLIAEILIWGDQNDPAIMDFFLDKNLLEHFIKYLKQNPGRVVCVQLLQTLNILFENISNKGAVHYLLSNNHTNEIITHRFDFADEEVVAYYISFLKTLSLNLNSQTIKFFYHESNREFDLYVECIKLFCHPENMVRIAVRVITLNVHRVNDKGALEFIHHQTALPYFSFLVWSIGNTVLDIDALLRSELSPQNLHRLDDLVAEHVDHLHYLNDLLSLAIEGINDVLCDLLHHRLLIPLHMYSLTKRYSATTRKKMGVQRPHVTQPVAAFILTHIFVIIHHADVISLLTEAIFLGDPGLTDLSLHPSVDSIAQLNTDQDSGHADLSRLSDTDDDDRSSYSSNEEPDPALTIAHSLVACTCAIRNARTAAAGHRLEAYMQHTRKPDRHPAFLQPRDSLTASLQKAKGVTPALLLSVWPPNLAPLRLMNGQENQTQPMPISTSENRSPPSPTPDDRSPFSDSMTLPSSSDTALPSSLGPSEVHSLTPDLHGPTVHQNSMFPVGSTPALRLLESSPKPEAPNDSNSVLQTSTDNSFELQGLPFLRALYRALEVGPGTDYETLFALLLFSAIRVNRGIDPSTLLLTGLSHADPSRSPPYDSLLVGKLLTLIADACKSGSRVRLITLHLAMRLLTDLVCDCQQHCHLSDEHFARLISAREEAMMVLRSYFRNDAIFLDLFEQELREVQQPLVPLHKLAMDSALLVTPLAAKVLPGSPAKSTKPRRDYRKRLPQTELEHTQRAIHVYLMVHISLESMLRARPQDEMPSEVTTTRPTVTMFSANLPVDIGSIPGLAGLDVIPDPKMAGTMHKAGDKLDLSSEALIGCTVESGGNHEKRFLVNFSQHLVLVEPDSRQMGWGVITFIGPLQDLEATCDPADSRCLHVTIHTPGHLTLTGQAPVGSSPARTSAATSRQGSPKHLLAARFLFEDHIRCMTARQMLLRGRELARQTKLRKIAMLLDFSPQFLRETFAFNTTFSTSYGGSMGDFTRRSNQTVPSENNSDRRLPVASARSNVGPNPSTFLMERQSNRSKHHHTQETDYLDPHLPPASMTRSTSTHSAAAILSSKKPPVPAITPLHLSEPTNLTPVTLVQQQLPTSYRTRTQNFPIRPVTDDTDIRSRHSPAKRPDSTSKSASIRASEKRVK